MEGRDPIGSYLGAEHNFGSLHLPEQKSHIPFAWNCGGEAGGRGTS